MKYASIFILFASLSILIGGYFAYQEYIYPSILNNSSQEQKILLDGDQELTLIKRQEQSNIYSFELEIAPNKHNYNIAISDGPRVIYEAAIKQGVEFVHSMDWYSDTCSLIFIPNKHARDSISVTYRFIGINH
jgi:hypothetical protein